MSEDSAALLFGCPKDLSVSTNEFVFALVFVVSQLKGVEIVILEMLRFPVSCFSLGSFDLILGIFPVLCECVWRCRGRG